MGKRNKSARSADASKHKDSTGGCTFCVAICIGFILIVFGLTAVNLHMVVYNYKYHELTGPGEFSARHIAKDLNPLLCHAYEVTPFLPANVFLIDGKAKVNRRHHKELKRRTDQLIPGSMRTNNAFYLLEGSEIHVNGCKEVAPFYNDDTAQILLFKGDDSWNRWSNGNCDDCSYASLTIKGDDYCGVSAASLTAEIKHRDTYYIALYTGNDVFSAFEAEAKIKQTTFHLRHIQEKCHMTSDCYLNLTYGKSQDVIVQFPDTTSISSFGTECKNRTLVWIGLFVLLPGWLVIMMLCCCCCCVCCGSEKKSKRRPDLETATSPLTGSKAHIIANEVLPDYKSTAHVGNVQFA